MLFRFCLYGFLKNQRYFEPFLVLAFRDLGLSFGWIGALIGFRELVTNLMEIPSGAIADSVGRRFSMIASHVMYVVSFLLFGFAETLPLLFLAMFLFGVGEAFRTGTHKAMIFDWLARQNRGDEKTRVYGLTRSWSKIGSAVSVLLAAGFLIGTQRYAVVFWFSAIAAGLNIVNFLTYPRELDGRDDSSEARAGFFARTARVMKTLGEGLAGSWRTRSLRRLVLESMSFEGLYKGSSDYLQPVLKNAALMLPLFLSFSDLARTAMLVAIVYAVLYLLSSVASRHAAALVDWFRDEVKASRGIWIGYAVAFGGITIGVLLTRTWLTIVGFVLMAILQNFWRPIIVGRIGSESEPRTMATVLSVESQAKSFFAALAAPLLGVMIDRMGENLEFLPVGIFGLVVCGLFLVRYALGYPGEQKATTPS
jgi:MFS family permease